MSRPSNLHAQLANQLLEYIRVNDLPEGTHLAEPVLCERLKVSRTPVRASLKLLLEQGYVQHIPRRGYFTTNKTGILSANEMPESKEESLYLQIAEDRTNQSLPPQNSEADLLRRYPASRGELLRVLQRLLHEGLVEKRPGRGWMFTPVLDSKQMHDESYRFRLAIEPLALLETEFVLDEERASRSEEKHQRLLNGEVGQISAIELFEMNAEFHELLVASSGNRFFLQAIQQQNRLRRFVSYRWTYGADRVRETCQEHLAVLQAIRENNMSWASSVLRHHLEVSSTLLPYREAERLIDLAGIKPARTIHSKKHTKN